MMTASEFSDSNYQAEHTRYELTITAPGTTLVLTYRDEEAAIVTANGLLEAQEGVDFAIREITV